MKPVTLRLEGFGHGHVQCRLHIGGGVKLELIGGGERGREVEEGGGDYTVSLFLEGRECTLGLHQMGVAYLSVSWYSSGDVEVCGGAFATAYSRATFTITRITRITEWRHHLLLWYCGGRGVFILPKSLA